MKKNKKLTMIVTMVVIFVLNVNSVFAQTNGYYDTPDTAYPLSIAGYAQSFSFCLTDSNDYDWYSINNTSSNPLLINLALQSDPGINFNMDVYIYNSDKSVILLNTSAADKGAGQRDFFTNMLLPTEKAYICVRPNSASDYSSIKHYSLTYLQR